MDNLPQFKHGGVDWSKSIGYKVKFQYRNIIDELEILDYERNKKSFLTIKYNNKELELNISMFRQCWIGKLLAEDSISEAQYINIINDYKNKEQNKQTIKIFLENIPKWTKRTYDWKNSIGYKVYFIYEDIEGWLKIIDYKKQYLTIKYEDRILKINTGNFTKCMLGKLLKKRTFEFKIEIGTRFQDDKRDITIADKEYKPIYNKDKSIKQNEKWYKYTCYICGWTEGWNNEYNLLKGNGCACCNGRTVVEGINDIPTTAPWMIPYFQGGYEEAKLYTRCSDKYIYPKCPDCGRVKSNKVKIDSIHKYKSMRCSCSDKVPYPEKLMFSILEQLELDFKTQLTKTIIKWCNKYKYDFYFELNDEQFIIETHGGQHYLDAWNKLEKTQENDKLKKELALANRIKPENYIVIDCRYSELDWIKNNILDSRLAELFDLSKINWLKAEEFALSNLVKIACDLKKNNPNLTFIDIGNLMKIYRQTASTYIKKGEQLGWV